ncbi:MAG: hypothetical protein Q9170_005494 [Blastenia crenularia]
MAESPIHNLYQPLDEEQQEIRLLFLEPAPNLHDPLIANLKIVSLREAPFYEAISYCWGDPTGTQDIEINGCTTTIAASLLGALRRFRFEAEYSRGLWADALCINQNDTLERNAQVRLMAQIYSQAHCVLIWLGEHDTNTETAFSILKDLARGTSMAKLQRNEEIPYITPTAILTIFSRPWFQRLWVVQEVLLAEQAHLFCGAYHVDFDTIKSLVALYIEKHGIFDMEGSLQDRLNSDISQVINQFFHEYLGTISDIQHHQDNKNLAVLLINKCRKLRCKEPRDKIYGLLHLMRMEDAIEVNYDRPLLDVYRDAALIYIQRTEGPLILLDAFRRDFSQLTVDWPSWVPDWRRLPIAKSRTSGDWGDKLSYNATLDAIYEIPKVLNFSIMTVKAILHSTLDVVGETLVAYEYTEEARAQNASHELLIGPSSRLPTSSRVVQQLQSWQTTLQASKHDFWRIVFAERFGASFNAMSPDERKNGGVRMTDQDCEPCIQAWNDLYPTPSTTTTADEDALSRYAGFFQGIESLLVDTRPFRTSSGLAGHGPRNIEMGDHVAIIAGIPCPMILRHVPGREKNQFWSVGPCYVLGIMHGEAISKLWQQRGGICKREEVFEEIHIV